LSQFLYHYLWEICSVSAIKWTEVQCAECLNRPTLKQQSRIDVTLQCSWGFKFQGLRGPKRVDPRPLKMKTLCSKHKETLVQWHSVTSRKTWILQHKTHLQWTVGYAVVSWLRHCITSQKVVGSIPDGFIGIFHWHNASSCTMALELTQPLTQMSTRNIFWGGKGGWCMGVTTLPPFCANCLEIWEPHPPGALRACPGP
jgi:hypothetical protein